MNKQETEAERRTAAQAAERAAVTPEEDLTVPQDEISSAKCIATIQLLALQDDMQAFTWEEMLRQEAMEAARAAEAATTLLMR